MTSRWRLFVEALVLIVLVRIGLRTLPFLTVRRCLDPAQAASGGSAATDRIAWAVQAAGRRVPGTTCLVEALVAHRMLRRFGHAALLRIGVRRGDALTLDAHAWVECEGAVVIGTVIALSDYAILS